MNKIALFVITTGFAAAAHSADIEAGRSKALACTACHGANGISVSADIPNLAGQKDKYLTAQLEAFRAGERKNAMMNAMAAQLSDTDIENIVAFFSSLPPADATEVSAAGKALQVHRIEFPSSYQSDLTMYMTRNRPKIKQVRYLYANAAALEGARTGQPMGDGALIFVEIFKAKLDDQGNPITGDDGFFVQDAPLAFTAMQKRSGWGAEIPAELRNGDWNYAVFNLDGTHKEGTNQGKCLACHKPLDDIDYVFTYEQIANKAEQAN